MGVSVQLHRPAASPARRKSGTHLTGGRIGPTAGVELLEKKKNFLRCWVTKPGPTGP